MDVATVAATGERITAARASALTRSRRLGAFLCPCCDEEVRLVHERRMCAHFRHARGVASSECENYVAGVASGDETGGDARRRYPPSSDDSSLGPRLVLVPGERPELLILVPRGLLREGTLMIDAALPTPAPIPAAALMRSDVAMPVRPLAEYVLRTQDGAASWRVAGVTHGVVFSMNSGRRMSEREPLEVGAGYAALLRPELRGELPEALGPRVFAIEGAQLTSLTVPLDLDDITRAWIVRVLGRAAIAPRARPIVLAPGGVTPGGPARVPAEEPLVIGWSRTLGSPSPKSLTVAREGHEPSTLEIHATAAAIRLEATSRPLVLWFDDDRRHPLRVEPERAPSFAPNASVTVIRGEVVAPTHAPSAQRLFASACDASEPVRFATGLLEITPTVYVDGKPSRAAPDRAGLDVLDAISAGANEIQVDFGQFGVVGWRRPRALDGHCALDPNVLRVLVAMPRSRTDRLPTPPAAHAALKNAEGGDALLRALARAVRARRLWPAHAGGYLTQLSRPREVGHV